jgi:large subunit ribosomal protein L16
VLFEVEGVSAKLAAEGLRLAATKLPIKTKFVSREMATGGGNEG